MYSPWLLLLLWPSPSSPASSARRTSPRSSTPLLFRWTPERRQLDYLRYVGASDEHGEGSADVRARAVARRALPPLSRSASTRRTSGCSIRKGVSRPRCRSSARSATTAPTSSSSCAPCTGASRSARSPSSPARSRAAAISSSACCSAASGIYEQWLYLKDLFVFFEMKPTITLAPGAPRCRARSARASCSRTSASGTLAATRWAVRHVNFRLRPGERIALVGENGAGKTTITKLLARLYDPTEGRILLDGVDLRDYDLASVRRAIGVIFQDFVRYDMRFDENIGVGEIEAVQAYLDLSDAGERATGCSRGTEAIPAWRGARAHRRGGRAVAGLLAAPAFPRRLPADARPPLRGRRRPLGRRVAEDRAGARLHARRAGADPRRADRGARRARRVRGLPALLRS